MTAPATRSRQPGLRGQLCPNRNVRNDTTRAQHYVTRAAARPSRALDNLALVAWSVGTQGYQKGQTTPPPAARLLNSGQTHTSQNKSTRTSLPIKAHDPTEANTLEHETCHLEHIKDSSALNILF